MYKECASCKEKCVPLNIVNSDALAEWNEWSYKKESYEKNRKNITTKKFQRRS